MRVQRTEKLFLFEDIERVAEFALKDAQGFNKQTQERRSFQGEKKVSGTEVGKCQRTGEKPSLAAKQSQREKLVNITGRARLQVQQTKGIPSQLVTNNGSCLKYYTER